MPGADAIDARPGFAAALEQIAGNGVRTIIVETANRFARDLIVQETGFRRLQADGITLVAADKPDSFGDDTPTAVLIPQILGAVSQFDKAMTVANCAVPASGSAARPAPRSKAVRASPKAIQRLLQWLASLPSSDHGSHCARSAQRWQRPVSSPSRRSRARSGLVASPIRHRQSLR